MASLQAFITNGGLVVVNSLALSGNTLKVTRAHLGDGVVASESDAKALTDLIHGTIAADIVGMSVKDGWHIISVRISNNNLATDLTVNEIGLYCPDPADPEKEVMFYYATFGDKPDWIAPGTLAHYTRTYDLCLNVGLVESINVVISPDALVTIEEMETAMQPRKLLDKIVSVSGAGTGLDADMLDGKHASAFANKSHTHALNSSELTGILPVSKGGTGAAAADQALEKLGAAPSGHIHDLASFSVSGILPVSKGGTGGTTSAEARTQLGAASSDHTHGLGASTITGTLPISKGGTGATSAAAARAALEITLANIGAAANGHSHALSADTITGTLPIAKGGTGATTAAAARNALGLGNTAGAVPVANGGTGATNAANARANLGAVAKAGDTMTGALQSTADTATPFKASRVIDGVTYAVSIGINASGNAVLYYTINGEEAGYLSLRDGGVGFMEALPIASGGTGATTAAAARNALGLGNTTGAVPVANGGTGASNAAAARTNLGITLANLGAAASGHSHALTASSITGTLPINKGGTGATSVAAARNALGLGNTDGALPVANGGTGATTAANARTNLGITLSNLGAAASGHGHGLSDSVITGTLPIAKGGTGATTVAAARNALGLGNTTGAVPIANGGTGATTAAAARTNLGITLANLGAAASGHSHALTASTITGTLPISKGGTGATTAAAALQALGIQYSTNEPAVVNGGIWLKPV